METFECIATRLDLKEFSGRAVADDVVYRVLEAGRLTGSGGGARHSHFVLVLDGDSLSKLGEDCPDGSWVAGASFAVIFLTSLRWPLHPLDAGRVLQDMQLAAWDMGVASSPTTAFSEEAMRIDFNIPRDLSISAVLGFGYPPAGIVGRQDRRPLVEVASLDRYGNPLASRQRLS